MAAKRGKGGAGKRGAEKAATGRGASGRRAARKAAARGAGAKPRTRSADAQALLDELRALVAAEREAARASMPEIGTLTSTGAYARPRGRPATVREGRVRKEFWLDPDVLADAKEYYGTDTERETVERALEQAAWTARVVRSVDALKDLDLEDPESW
ncbi:MAG: hypothetical protein MUF00_02990 [Gemmatimonadaceae bacterium]|jgi:Arc/MetJ family transcription regulator|nr:hypothetical protein [Gemmatimonadaceae bacterium]